MYWDIKSKLFGYLVRFRTMIWREEMNFDVGITSQCYFRSEPGHISSTLWFKTLAEYSDKTHAYASCKTSVQV